MLHHKGEPDLFMFWLQVSKSKWTTGRAPLDQASCDRDDDAAPSKDMSVRPSSEDRPGGILLS